MQITMPFSHTSPSLSVYIGLLGATYILTVQTILKEV
jgi:hypothetical protein